MSYPQGPLHIDWKGERVEEKNQEKQGDKNTFLFQTISAMRKLKNSSSNSKVRIYEHTPMKATIFNVGTVRRLLVLTSGILVIFAVNTCPYYILNKRSICKQCFYILHGLPRVFQYH